VVLVIAHEEQAKLTQQFGPVSYKQPPHICSYRYHTDVSHELAHNPGWITLIKTSILKRLYAIHPAVY
jgi:hypothetical protein